MFYMDDDEGAVHRHARAHGDEADRRPPGARRRRAQRLRHDRQRHRRQGPAVLRQALPQRVQDIDKAKSLLKAAGQSNLTVDAADLGPDPGLRRVGARCCSSRRRPPASRSSSRTSTANCVLQPVAAVPEDAVRRDAVAGQLAQVLLPAGARLRRAVQRDALQERRVRTTLLNNAIAAPNKAKAQVVLEPGAEDPVRLGRLHQLDQRRLRRRALEEGPGPEAGSAAGSLGNHRFLERLEDVTSSQPALEPRERCGMTTAAAPRAPSVARGRRPCCGSSRAGRSGAIVGHVRRLGPDLRRHPGPAGQRRERGARAQRNAGGGARPSTSSCTSTSPLVQLLRRLARRASCAAISATRRSALAQGAKTAPIWPLISSPLKNSAILAAITALLMIPLSLGLGVLAAVYAGALASTTSISLGVAGGDLAARVRDRLAADRALLRRARLLPPVALVAPGASPLEQARRRSSCRC